MRGAHRDEFLKPDSPAAVFLRDADHQPHVARHHRLLALAPARLPPPQLHHRQPRRLRPFLHRHRAPQRLVRRVSRSLELQELLNAFGVFYFLRGCEQARVTPRGFEHGEDRVVRHSAKLLQRQVLLFAGFW
ncbi:unnamed protein product [Closterium sp. NIES-54]